MDPNRRSASPDRRSGAPRRPKELSFYKKSASSSSHHASGGAGAGAVGSFSSRRDPLDRLDDKRRAGAAAAAPVPAPGAGQDVFGRYGGSRGEYNRPSTGPRGDDYRDRRDDRPRYSDRDSYDDDGRGRGHRDGGRDSGRGYDRDRTRDDLAGEYKGGEPLRRVPTRDERDQGSSSSYRGGDDLRRVETRNEPSAPAAKRPAPTCAPIAYGPMIEIIANDRLGRKVRVKCLPSDTVGDLKKLIAAQTGTIASKIQLKKWYTTYKDHIELRDYEIHDGMSLEMY